MIRVRVLSSYRNCSSHKPRRKCRFSGRASAKIMSLSPLRLNTGIHRDVPAYFDFTIDLCKAKTPLRQRDPTSPLSNNGPVIAASAAHSWGQHILSSLDGRSLFNCNRILGNVRQNQVRSTHRAWSLPLSGPTRSMSSLHLCCAQPSYCHC